MKKITLTLIFLLMFIVSIMSATATTDFTEDCIMFIPLFNTTGSQSGLADLTGNNNDGIAYSATFTDANKNSFDFAGNSNYVTFGNPMYGESEYTLTMWVYRDGTSTDTFWECGCGTAGAFNEFFIPDSYQFYIFNGGTIDNPGTMSSLNWYQLTYTFEANGNIKVYSNGVLRGTEVNTQAMGSNTCRLNGANNPLDGKISDVKLWNKIFTQTEVTELYSKGRNYNPFTSEVPINGIAYYDFNDRVEDQWDANDGIVTGMTYGTNYPVFDYFGSGSTKAGNFDGINDYVTIPKEEITDITTKLSLSFWIKVNTLGTEESPISWDGIGYDGFIRKGISNNWIFNVENQSGSSKELNPINFITDTDWHQVILTVDTVNNNMTIYKDRILVNTEILGFTGDLEFATTNDFLIGDGVYGNFNGSIDEFKLFNTALNSTEISNLYDCGDETGCSGEIAYYNFNDNVLDQWNSNDGTVNGMTYTTDYPTYGIFGNGTTKAGSFDGNGDGVTINLYSGNVGTACAWVNVAEYFSSNTGIWQTNGNVQEFIIDSSNKIYAPATNLEGTQSKRIYGSTTIIPNNYYHVCIDYDTFKVYLNGVDDTASTSGITTVSHQNTWNIGGFLSSRADFNGSIDEVKIWERALSPTEIEQIYNYGIVDAQEPLFVQQTPTDLTSTNLLAEDNGLNITFNTTIYNLTNFYLNYTVNRSTAGCLVSLNGTCIVTNGLYRSVDYTTARLPNYDWLLDGDNTVYPGVFNTVYTHFNSTSILNFTIDRDKEAIFSELYTINNETKYSFYEIGANLSDSAMEVYAFNTSYDQTSDFRKNSNVVKITEIAEGTAPNHCHDAVNCHYVVGFPIINGTINGLKLSDTMGFIITQPKGSGTLTVEYITEPVRTDTTRTTTNKKDWTSRAWSLNNHMHQFDGTDAMTYQACAVNATDTFCTTFRTDTFEPGDFPPTSPQVTNPTETNYTKENINITWNPSTADSGSINNYIVQLLNSDLTFNKTITSLNATSYYWDYFASNVSAGNYYIKVIANDSDNRTNSDTSEQFRIVYDKRLNITAYYQGTNETINNFSVTITGVRSENGSTTSGLYQFYGTEGNYDIVIDAEGYSYQTTITTLDLRDDYVNITLYKLNTVNMNFYDSDTQSLLTGVNVSFSLIREELYATNNYTTTGNKIVELLQAGSYEIRFNSDGYAEGNYFFTLAEREYTEISLYLINSTGSSNVTSILYDENGNTLSGYIIKYLKYYPETSSYIEIASKKTNEEGKAVMSLVLNDPYYKVKILNEDNTLVKTTSSTQLYESTVIYYVTLGDSTIELLDRINGITSTLTHTGTQFRYEFDQSNNVDVTATLQVYKQKIEGNELVSTTSVTSASGIIYANTTVINGTTYIAKAFIQYSGENQYLDQVLTKTYDENPKPFGMGGIFLVIILIIGMCGIFARQPFAILLIVPLILTLATFLSLIVINKIIIVSLWGVSAIILYIIRDKA